MNQKMLKNMMVGISASLALVSCASQKYDADAEIDAHQKTIAMPTGRTGIIGDLKTEFRKNGWTIVANSQRVSEQVETAKTVSYNGNARYTFNYEWYQVDYDIFTFQPILNFSASIVDNQTGREAISFDANYTKKSTCVRKLMQAMEEHTK